MKPTLHQLTPENISEDENKTEAYLHNKSHHNNHEQQ